MATITITNPHTKSATTRKFNFVTSARTWLLLAGFLPLTDSPSETQYQHTFTGDIAVINIRSEQHV